MKSSNALFLLLLAMSIAAGCRKPMALQYMDVINFKINTLDMKESVISADIQYYNPNNFQMKLKKAEMDISVNDKFLGRSTLDTMMNIPKADTFLIPVHLKVDMKTLISNSLIALFSNEVDVKLEGNAKLGKSGIFFNFPFSYQGKQKLNLFQ